MSFIRLPHQPPLMHMVHTVVSISIIPKSSIYLLHTVLEKREERERESILPYLIH